ncbi:MAG: 30S ribosomal protein S4 [Candidatus Pacebacteria bacterium]|nr:30S ribosomal protein S4 [Candidatus Paceibacterota bacterium]NUQ57472.1 30S ribosomal protein S4 [Candidatus Paceibacter sp.]
MLTDKCKKCRRAGEKLFLKGERCFTAKCAIARKPYLPGPATKSGRPRRASVSEYGAKLREAQKTKFSYGIRTRQYENYMKEAAVKAAGGNVKAGLFGLLESRLDNVVYRLGLAESRSVARQMVTHGHIMVNGRRVNVPSRRVFIGDKISIRPQSAVKGKFKDLDVKMKKYNPPAWLRMDKAKKEGEIVGAPSAENI